MPIGKAAVDALRNCLSPETRDKLCPLRNGGVSLHKLYGVMHDTCNCANKVALIAIIRLPHSCFLPVTLTLPSILKVATLMIELRDRKCAQHYGEDGWARADAKTKACFNFLCGNHTRNLPTVRFQQSV